MDTLVRTASTTLQFRLRSDGYEPLDQSNGTTSNDHGGGQRTYSKRKNDHQRDHRMMTSVGFRLERAKKRQIFLKTYKLPPINSSAKPSRFPKIKRVINRVNLVVVSIVSYMRLSSLRSCNSRSAIHASSPSPIQKYF